MRVSDPVNLFAALASPPGRFPDSVLFSPYPFRPVPFCCIDRLQFMPPGRPVSLLCVLAFRLAAPSPVSIAYRIATMTAVVHNQVFGAGRSLPGKLAGIAGTVASSGRGASVERALAVGTESGSQNRFSCRGNSCSWLGSVSKNGVIDPAPRMCH